MINKYFQSYFAIAFVLCLLFIIPKSFTEKLREVGAQVTAPIYSGLFFNKSSVMKQDLDQLALENTLLSKQIQEVRDYLVSEERLEEHFKKLDAVRSEKQELIKRREELLVDNLKRQLESVSAKVVYREPAFWSSLFWINVGERDNQALGYELIAYNSPVVIGSVIVGVIDYVGKNQSRVRLITDASISASVRILRGSEQNRFLLDQLNLLIDQLKFRQELFFSSEEQTNTLSILCDLQDNLKTSVHDRYLAKGELHGSSSPLWRSRLQKLKGIGFNYDYEDEEGPARDLRTGEPINKGDLSSEILLKEGDLLVTTGMDGVFPEGFHIAIVDKILPLEEGAISYSLEAKSLIANFDEIYKVSVLAPLREIPFSIEEL